VTRFEARLFEVDAEEVGEIARVEPGGLLLGYLIGTLGLALPLDAARIFGDDGETGDRDGDKDLVALFGDRKVNESASRAVTLPSSSAKSTSLGA
jgi:hypothetical protein